MKVTFWSFCFQDRSTEYFAVLVLYRNSELKKTKQKKQTRLLEVSIKSIVDDLDKNQRIIAVNKVGDRLRPTAATISAVTTDVPATAHGA